jgi:hypothetical protein
MIVDCGKRRYSTKGYAKAALKRAKRKGSLNGRHAPRTYYKCPKCGEFHLSSYPPNRQRLLPLPEEAAA